MRYDTVDKSSATKYQIAIIFARSIPLGRVLALSKCNAPVPLSAAASPPLAPRRRPLRIPRRPPEDLEAGLGGDLAADLRGCAFYDRQGSDF
eukprot:5442385-Pyramimonas_sp.AAC.2